MNDGRHPADGGGASGSGADSIRVTVNGVPRSLSAATTVAQLITELAGSHRGSAVAVDGAVVPRSQWPVTRLAAGQAVELLTAVQGG